MTAVDHRSIQLLTAYAANAAPCPRCLVLATQDALRLECVLPLFAGAIAPHAVDAWMDRVGLRPTDDLVEE